LGPEETAAKSFDFFTEQAWYAEFLLEINHKILLKKTGTRLIFKIALISLHIGSSASFTWLTFVFNANFGNFHLHHTHNFVI
jgi:hypothetical protein